MSALIAIATKDLRLLARDRGDLFFTFVFPLLFAIFFGVVFGGGSDGARSKMSIGLVNLDGRPASVKFAADLSADAALDVRTFASRQDAESKVRLGHVTAAVVISSDFQDQADGLFSGRTLEVEAVRDPARSAEAGLLEGKLNQVAFRQFDSLMRDRERMRKAMDSARSAVLANQSIDPARRLMFTAFFGALDSLTADLNRSESTGGPADGNAGTPPGAFNFQPVRVSMTALAMQRAMPPSSYTVSFPQGIVWGLMGCVMSFGISLVGEKRRGTLVRLTTSPISRSHILLAKALACFVACLIVQGLLLLTGYLAFRVQPANPGMTLAAIVCSAIGFTGIMMILAGAARSEGTAAGAGRAIVLILAMIGGGTIPLFFMPPFMQTLANISPFTWSTRALDLGLWRGQSPDELLLPCAVLISMGAVGYFIGARLFRWADGVS